jgi:putative ABC transport system permease protein
LAAGALGVALLTVAAVGVLHAMAVLLDARRREIAVLRSVGVSGRAVTWSLLFEVAVTGATAAAVGVVLALLAGVAADQMLARWLPELPFRPGRLVVITPWLAVASVVAGTAASMTGAWWPIRRAIGTDPVEGLRPR